MSSRWGCWIYVEGPDFLHTRFSTHDTQWFATELNLVILQFFRFYMGIVQFLYIQNEKSSLCIVLLQNFQYDGWQ